MHTRVEQDGGLRPVGMLHVAKAAFDAKKARQQAATGKRSRKQATTAEQQSS